jgi:hypothetical protein
MERYEFVGAVDESGQKNGMFKKIDELRMVRAFRVVPCAVSLWA